MFSNLSDATDGQNPLTKRLSLALMSNVVQKVDEEEKAKKVLEVGSKESRNLFRKQDTSHWNFDKASNNNFIESIDTSMKRTVLT